MFKSEKPAQKKIKQSLISRLERFLPRVRIRTKILLGFILIVLLGTMGGFIGVYGSLKLKKSNTSVGTGLKKVEGILTIGKEMELIMSTHLSLVNPSITIQEREGVYREIQMALLRLQKARENFRGLIQGEQEQKTADRFEKAIVKWIKKTENFIALSKKIDDMGVTNPANINGLLERYKGDHYAWMLQLERAINNKKPFRGQIEEKKSPLVDGLKHYKTVNKNITRSQKAALKALLSIFEKGKTVKRLLQGRRSNKNFTRAKKIYQREIIPLSGVLIKELKTMLGEIQKVGEVSKQLNSRSKSLSMSFEVTRLGLMSLEGKNKKAAENAATEGEIMAEETIKWIFISMLGGFSATIFLGIFLPMRISNPVEELLSLVQDMAQGEGDLTKRLKIKTKDEIEELSIALNTFMEKLYIIIKEIAGKADELNSSAGELSGLAKEVLYGATDMDDLSTASSNLINESSENINTVAATGEELSKGVEEIAKNTSSAQLVTEKAVENIRIISNQTEQFQASANEISDIVRIISEIAVQTDLLALNAAIEAARAGEAGRGFSVVANEVMNLSARTKTATEDINEKIEKMEESTKLIVSQIEHFKNTVTEINQIVESIATSMVQQSEATNEISRNIAQIADNIEKNVSEKITSVNTCSREMSKNADELEHKAVLLSQVGVSLKDIVSRFKL